MEKNKKVKKAPKNNTKKIEKKEPKQKKKKGFTLIELLAVIIILGILMIIAIPAVTSYISDSRKSAYVNTAKEIVSGTRNLVNEGKLGMYDTNITYYIPASCINTENNFESPYGTFVKAYVGVNFDGDGYTYYWLSTDSEHMGIKDLIEADKLDTDYVLPEVTEDDVNIEVGIEGRKNIQIFNDDCSDIKTSSPASEIYWSNGICKRATVLHTTECTAGNATFYCSGAGYTPTGKMKTSTITYGSLGTKGSEPAPGDAYDCDVNGDGIYDPNTERFYYVKNYGEKSVLVFYTSVKNGVTPTQENFAYYSDETLNWKGPKTAALQLPSRLQWKNTQLIAPSKRNIKNELGGSTVGSGENIQNIEEFTYGDKVARLLTYQEVVDACGSGTVRSRGYLDKCNYFMENVARYETQTYGAFGYWLETPLSSFGFATWYVSCDDRMLDYSMSFCTGCDGVRPAITVLTKNVEK